MPTFSPQKFEDFFEFYDPTVPQHRAAVEELGQKIQALDNTLLSDEANWVRIYRKPRTSPPGVGLFPLDFQVPERQLRSPDYPTVKSPVLGTLTFTGGFMEPHGHSWKPGTQAIFGAGNLMSLPESNRNLGVDYHVSDLQIRVWYGGTVTRVGLEGGYGNRCHVETVVSYKYQGKSYPVYTAYAHAKSFQVRAGDKVKAGQVIGVQGGTGAGGAEVYPSHVDLRLWINLDGRIIDVSPNALESQLRQGIKPSQATQGSAFEKALQFALKWEGGLADHVNDYGGRTNRGVTQANYDRWRTAQKLPRQDVAKLTLAEAERIYRENYWRWESRTLEMNDALEIADFDTCVNFGVAGATMFLQEVLKLPVDGIFGPRTLAAVLANNNRETALKLCQARMNYRHQRVVEDASQKVFLNGWLNRDNALFELVKTI